MAWTNSTVVMGFYLGIGDFLSAIPTANELLRNGNRVLMIVSRPNVSLSKLIRFTSPDVEFLEFAPFSKSPLRSMPSPLALTKARPDFLMVSPHAQRNVSSWKLPLLLWVLKHVLPGRPLVVGAADERLSRLYDVQLAVDKNTRLIEREWSLYTKAGAIDAAAVLDTEVFDRSALDELPTAKYDLVIHPGASRDVKKWPLEHHRDLVARLDPNLRIAYLGMPHELTPLQKVVDGRPNVSFVSVPVAEAVAVVAGASAVLTMDSGFSHIAALLRVRHLALFGSTDPSNYRPPSPNSTALYRRELPCQPCQQHSCRLSHVACMRIFTPEEVANRLEKILAGASVPHPESFTTQPNDTIAAAG